MILLRTLALAALAGWLASLARWPLPWTLGPLVLTAAMSVSGVAVTAPRALRQAGQWVIGVALGLHFDPAVAAALWQHAPLILGGVAWSLLAGWLLTEWLRHRGAGPLTVDPATAWFSGSIGGASEMVTLAERHGGSTGLVATAHSVRLLLVLLIVPPVLQWSGGAAGLRLAPSGGVVQPLHLAGLTVATVAAALAWQRLKGPSPWIFAPLLLTGALHVSHVPLSALPPWLTPAGQVLLAVSLGAGFRPEVVRAAPRWVMSVVGGTLLILLLGGLMAVAGAVALRTDWRSVALGTAPGGMVEMCLTAEVLHLGVPLVTACHLARTVVIMTVSGWLFRHWRTRRA